MLHIENLTKIYNNDLISRITRKEKIKAVDNVSLEIQDGEIFGLLGPNGAGKTTIIKMVCGLLLPTSGDIKIDNISVTKKRQKTLSKIGVTLEGSRNVYYRLTVRENLWYFGILRHIPSGELNKRIDFLIDYFELKKKKNELAMRLSSGMKQKLNIAIALTADPQILLLDELGAGIDVHTIDMVEKLIVKVVKNFKKTAIITTHQLDIAERICRRVSIINEGRIVATDCIEGLRGQKKDLRSIFLDITKRGAT